MLLLLVAVLCMTSTLSLATDVKVLPLGVTREFVCTSPPGTGYAIGWVVNGSSVVSSQFQDYIVLGEEVHSESGGVQRSLTYIADARANNTHILCTATYYYNEEFGNLVLVDVSLALQGHVSPPAVTYEMSSDHHSVMFSWSAPFTLNISDMEPDILHYVVYIISDDGHIVAMNETGTHYELQADPCQSYHVAIAAVNVVGEGELYMSPEINLPPENAVASVSHSTVSFNGSVVLIQITLEVSPHCPDPEFVLKYEVELDATYSQDRLLFSSSGSARQHTLSLSSNDNGPRMNELYDCSVRIEGLPNSESTIVQLRTFDVQDVSTIVRDQYSGYVDITCHFVRGSNVKGCRIVVQNIATFCEFIATREDSNESTVTVALPSGTYTLLVYDDEHKGDNNPAFNTTLTVHNSAQVSGCLIVQNHQSTEFGTEPSDCKSQSTSPNYVLLSVTAAGGLVSFVVTSLICLTVLTVLIRRERKKAAIVMTPNIAYEEVKMKKKNRQKTPNHAQPVLTPNQDQ